MTQNFNITIRGLIIGCLCLFFAGLSAGSHKSETSATTVTTFEELGTRTLAGASH